MLDANLMPPIVSKQHCTVVEITAVEMNIRNVKNEHWTVTRQTNAWY